MTANWTPSTYAEAVAYGRELASKLTDAEVALERAKARLAATQREYARIMALQDALYAQRLNAPHPITSREYARIMALQGDLHAQRVNASHPTTSTETR